MPQPEELPGHRRLGASVPRAGPRPSARRPDACPAAPRATPEHPPRATGRPPSARTRRRPRRPRPRVRRHGHRVPLARPRDYPSTPRATCRPARPPMPHRGPRPGTRVRRTGEGPRAGASTEPREALRSTGGSGLSSGRPRADIPVRRSLGCRRVPPDGPVVRRATRSASGSSSRPDAGVSRREGPLWARSARLVRPGGTPGRTARAALRSTSPRHVSPPHLNPHQYRTTGNATTSSPRARRDKQKRHVPEVGDAPFE